MCPQPQVAGGCVIPLHVWFGFIQAAVSSPHRSHESHPVNPVPSHWLKLIYTSEAWIPPTAEGYDVERGNKWWWYQREACLLCSSQPASSSGSDSTVQSCCKPALTDTAMMVVMTRNTDFIQADFGTCPLCNRESYWIFNSSNMHYQLFYHYLHWNGDCWRQHLWTMNVLVLVFLRSNKTHAVCEVDA